MTFQNKITLLKETCSCVLFDLSTSSIQAQVPSTLRLSHLSHHITCAYSSLFCGWLLLSTHIGWQWRGFDVPSVVSRCSRKKMRRCLYRLPVYCIKGQKYFISITVGHWGHPLHHTLDRQWSLFYKRMRQLRCLKDGFRGKPSIAFNPWSSLPLHIHDCLFWHIYLGCYWN